MTIVTLRTMYVGDRGGQFPVNPYKFFLHSKCEGGAGGKPGGGTILSVPESG